MVWCGVVWCGVVWCGVVWCGVLCGWGLGAQGMVGCAVCQSEAAVQACVRVRWAGEVVGWGWVCACGGGVWSDPIPSDSV